MELWRLDQLRDQLDTMDNLFRESRAALNKVRELLEEYARKRDNKIWVRIRSALSDVGNNARMFVGDDLEHSFIETLEGES